MLAVNGISVTNNYSQQDKLIANIKKITREMPSLNRLKGNDVVDISSQAKAIRFAKAFSNQFNQAAQATKAQEPQQERSKIQEMLTGGTQQTARVSELPYEALSSTPIVKKQSESKKESTVQSSLFPEISTESEVTSTNKTPSTRNFNLNFIRVLNPIFA
ncbi:MAG: hypothetical protein HQK84_04915 [Nitrospinae bacterium]|nr:hypothetical protein [Nitrospinota bacterium]